MFDTLLFCLVNQTANQRPKVGGRRSHIVKSKQSLQNFVFVVDNDFEYKTWKMWAHELG